jgi:hypothetical protein
MIFNCFLFRIFNATPHDRLLRLRWRSSKDAAGSPVFRREEEKLEQHPSSIAARKEPRLWH